jgi:uncharacterized protein (DUF433 family)
MNEFLCEDGRTPMIEGTRITIFDIWDYAKDGWHADAIATTLRLSSIQVDAALKFIHAHKDETC